jgi:hypothetical protein
LIFENRYAIDVNVERAEDVLMHKKMLELAKDPDKRPAFSVRVVQVTILNEILIFVISIWKSIWDLVNVLYCYIDFLCRYLF